MRFLLVKAQTALQAGRFNSCRKLLSSLMFGVLFWKQMVSGKHSEEEFALKRQREKQSLLSLA